MTVVIKKDNSTEPFDGQKIITACKKAAMRCDCKMTEEDLNKVVESVSAYANALDKVSVTLLHELVISALSGNGFKEVSNSYAEYRYYKTQYAKTFEKLRQDADDVLRLGDRENANFDSSLVSTKGSLIKGYLTKSLYKQFYLSKQEKALTERGDIYIHDMRDMILGCVNCTSMSTWVTIRKNGVISTLQMKDLQKLLDVEEGVFAISKGIQILSRNGWAHLEGISVRKLRDNEPLYKIHIKNGLELKVTEGHRIPVLQDDGTEVVKLVKELNVGDKMLTMDGAEIGDNFEILNLCDFVDPDQTFVGGMVALKRYFEYAYKGKTLRAYCQENNIECDKNLRTMHVREFNKLRKLIQIPYDVYVQLTLSRKGAGAKVPVHLTVTDELARLFGYVFADGCVQKPNPARGCYQVTFSSTHNDLLEDCVYCAQKAFPDVNVIRRKASSTSTTPCEAVTLCNAVVWDLFKCKQGAYNITVPDFIMHGTDSIKYNFLAAAMDCDGNYSDTRIVYTTVAPKYAEQMVLLWQSLGYTPTITKDHAKGSIYKAKQRVGVRNYDTYYVGLSKYEEQKRFIEMTQGIRKKPSSLKERAIVSSTPTKILRIEKEFPEDEYVYDLQTSDSWFIANGYVVHNCCLFDIKEVLDGGFEMSNVHYTEPKTVLSALQVIGDITLVATAQQFGGFTLAELDKTLLKYVKKSYNANYYRYFNELGLEKDKAERQARLDTIREIEQGFQSLELKLNTVPCSRGDFAFTTITFGQWDYKNIAKDDAFWLMTIGKVILETRRKGHGENHRPVVFPKLVFLYDKKQIDADVYSKDLFDEAVKTSASCMYPDYLSLSSEYGTVSELFQKTGAITSPMGCRAYLSPWANEKGEYITIGRCNIGAVSLNIPLILRITQKEHPDDWQAQFWPALDERLEVIREFLKKRYDVVRHQICSSNPLAFTQGGFYEGHKNPDDEVGDLVRYMTASFGITALDQASYLWCGKRLAEDQDFSTQVLKHIQEKINEYKHEDGYLYAIYGTPAESLCATQAKQYDEWCKKEGVENVFRGSEHYSPDYFTNSFHCNVSEDITPFEKQDKEFTNFHIAAGGHIQYVRVDNPENLDALKAVVERGMQLGFYQGVNFDAVYCNDCGEHSSNSLGKCPKCGSRNISVISRVCGYLGYTNVNGKTRMNDGKLAEIHDRKSM